MLDSDDAPLQDEFLEPGYWGAILAAYEDELDEGPPEGSLNLDMVSRMMSSLRRLTARVAEYERLHTAELERLNRRRDELLGPVVRRAQSLENALRMFALQSYLDTGTTTVVTPNGILKGSRSLTTELVYDDAVVEKWLRPMLPDAVVDKPRIVKKLLRELLDKHEAKDGTFRRAIQEPDGTLDFLDIGEAWREPIPPGHHGVFVITVGEEPVVLAGLTWQPAGDAGSGRNFTIVVA